MRTLRAATVTGLVTMCQSVIMPMQVSGWYTQGDYPGTVEVTIINPKYSISEAVSVAIKDIEARGEPVNENNLRRALRLMSEGDVRLPEKRSDLNKIIKDAIKKYSRQQQLSAMKECKEPNAADFATCNEFTAEYIAYKKKIMSDSMRDQWSKRLGGMNEFSRECKKEAVKLWQKRQQK